MTHSRTPPQPPLSIWTVYDKPRDFPNTVIARRFEVTSRAIRPTDDLIVGPDITRVREQLAIRHLTRIERQPDDDPKVVEVWL